MAVEYRQFSLRLDKDIRAWVAEFAQQVGLSDSGAVRLILRNAMGEPMVAAVLKEEVIRVRALTQERVERAQKVMWAALKDEIADLEHEVMGPERVEPDAPPRALPARGEDIVEGEIETEGLHGGRRRRSRSRG